MMNHAKAPDKPTPDLNQLVVGIVAQAIGEAPQEDAKDQETRRRHPMPSWTSEGRKGPCQESLRREKETDSPQSGGEEMGQRKKA
jgi:hypothetical protein